MTPCALAKVCRVPRTRIERVVNESAPVTPDTALRLARYFGTTPQFWLGIQARYDVEMTLRSTGQEIEAIQPRESSFAATSDTTR